MAGIPNAFWSQAGILDYLRANPEDYDGLVQRFGFVSKEGWMAKRKREIGNLGDIRREMVQPTHRPPEPTEDVPEDEEALERLFSAYKEVRNATNEVYRTERETYWTAPDNLPTGICFIGDVHVGSNFEIELFERDLDIIRQTDGLHVVFMGDALDNYKPQAKSGTGLYSALMGNPDTQAAYFIVRARSIKGKIRALLGGNHEAWDGKWAGIDRLPALAKDLGCPYFTEAGGSLFITVGAQRYHLICKHDARNKSGLNKGNAARRLWEDWPWSFENADVVVLAHLHEPHAEMPVRKGQPVTYLRTGAYKLHDPWAESNGYRPTYGVPLVVLMPDAREAVTFRGEHFLNGVRYLAAERSRYATNTDA